MKKISNIHFTTKFPFLLLVFWSLAMSHATAQTSHQNHSDLCWEGTLGSDIPVFLHYQKDHHMKVGEIIYLNTKEKQPISVIGNTHYEDGRFSMNEYSKDGNITGKLMVKQKGDSLVGHWYKPYSDQDYEIYLVKKDTLIPSQSLAANPSEISGDYFYQYGEKGSQGEFKIQKLSKDSIAIEAFSVTHAPARNIASIKDTVALTDNHFVYTVRQNKTWNDKECKIVIKGQFYRGFLQVTYTNDNPCRFYFGHNATLEGIFYKINDE